MIALLVFTVLGGRLVLLQLTDGRAYAAAGLKDRLTTTVLEARRGSIVDRNGNVLAQSLDARYVFADPTRVVDPAGTAAKLRDLLGVPVSELLPKLSSKTRADGKPDEFEYLARGLDPTTARVRTGARPAGHRHGVRPAARRTRARPRGEPDRLHRQRLGRPRPGWRRPTTSSCRASTARTRTRSATATCPRSCPAATTSRRRPGPGRASNSPSTATCSTRSSRCSTTTCRRRTRTSRPRSSWTRTPARCWPRRAIRPTTRPPGRAIRRPTGWTRPPRSRSTRARWPSSSRSPARSTRA